ncbi:MAPEG family protein [Spongiibacter sp. KMU-158]|uniref:MAPEG family protein n=1 Tax=Spongiibacter pelagi TaxID=2760804 RepID=A0A927GVJ0_9GAMM|nr:MAPEG family protein [Spongiibacter pelagi]MBD2857464.1 MAPEG family protein [Spongiibacter pelagi]
MTIAFWCLLIACLLPIVTAWACGYFRMKQLGKVDNKHPRAQYLQLEGAGARAVAAQQNAWEALPIFASGVLVAHAAGVAQGNADMAAMIFVAARILYPVFYIANIDMLRSLSFIVGLGASISLFVMAA